MLSNMNGTDLSPKPPLTQGLLRLLEPHLKEIENLLELTLGLILVVLESLGCVVVLVNIGVEEIVPGANPQSVEKRKLVSSLVHKVFIGVTAGRCIFSI